MSNDNYFFPSTTIISFVYFHLIYRLYGSIASDSWGSIAYALGCAKGNPRLGQGVSYCRVLEIVSGKSPFEGGGAKRRGMYA